MDLNLGRFSIGVRLGDTATRVPGVPRVGKTSSRLGGEMDTAIRLLAVGDAVIRLLGVGDVAIHLLRVGDVAIRLLGVGDTAMRFTVDRSIEGDLWRLLHVLFFYMDILLATFDLHFLCV